jgi:hypothetical protein
MATFKDREGKDWLVEITRGHLKPLKELFGLDLQDAIGKEKDNPLAAVFADTEKSGNLIWFLCRAEAERSGITEEPSPTASTGRRSRTRRPPSGRR